MVRGVGIEAPATAVRQAELLCALSLATDLSQGQTLEWELRSARLAFALAERMGLDATERAELYWVALLRFIGCTGHAHEVAVLFGDDLATRERAPTVDYGHATEALMDMVRHAGEGRPPAERVRMALSAVTGGRKAAEESFRGGCEVAELFAERLGFSAPIKAALWCAFERWDAKGFPNGVKGDAIPLSMRIVQVAQDADVAFRLGGTEQALAMARGRAGGAYDPAIVEHFCAAARDLLPVLQDDSPWLAVLHAEPTPHMTLDGEELDTALEAVADFADLKSPFTAGHSRSVAELAADAASRFGLSPSEARQLWRVGLVHDLGRTAVSNAIWDKPAPLTETEWERVRLHPYYSERMLARSTVLAALGNLGSMHHERCDASGYHRGVAATTLSMPARLLAAADAYQAMREPRAFRAGRSAADAARELRKDADDGRLDPDAVSAVLASAGHRAPRTSSGPALSPREVEVLRLVARGLTAKQVASNLGVSRRTVEHHTAHIYTKINVTTRGAAALYAIQHGLI